MNLQSFDIHQSLAIHPAFGLLPTFQQHRAPLKSTFATTLNRALHYPPFPHSHRLMPRVACRVLAGPALLGLLSASIFFCCRLPCTACSINSTSLRGQKPNKRNASFSVSNVAVITRLGCPGASCTREYSYSEKLSVCKLYKSGRFPCTYVYVYCNQK